MRTMKMTLALALVTLCLGAAVWADGMQQVKVPIAGAYMEPALGGPVAYTGVVTFYWTPATDSSGNPIWNHTSVLEGEAWSLANGVKFKIYGFCENCFNALASGNVTMTDQFWAVGVPGLAIPAFDGNLTVSLQVPKDATLPAVSVIALATR